MTRRRCSIKVLWIITGLMLMVRVSHVCWAADSKIPKYPAKSMDTVVPFAPGAGTDLMGRVMAEGLSKKWKHPINVVNKPGGNTIIGTNEVMRASPDGYTLLIDSPGSSSMQVGMKDLPYKVEQRTFIVRAAASPMAFIVPQNSVWKSLKDVVEAAKKDPGSLTWTSLGGTSGVDLVMRQFFLRLRASMCPRPKWSPSRGPLLPVIPWPGGMFSWAPYGRHDPPPCQWRECSLHRSDIT